MSVEAIRRAADLLAIGNRPAAAQALAETFAPIVPSTQRKAWSKERLVRVFKRDGFTDRYSGQPLIFPGALRALSVLAPEIFPYHPNWKQSATHPAYWIYYPTIDHVTPLARKGEDQEDNVVTTSMLRNGAKANWLCSELGWPKPEAPLLPDWDGLLPWFCRTYEVKPELQSVAALIAWYRAARAA